MPYDSVDRFAVLVFAGIGLLLVGGVNLALLRRGPRLRLGLTALAGVAGAGLAGLALPDWLAARSAAAVLAGALAGLVVGSRPVAVAVGWAAAMAGSVARGSARPAARWGVLVAAGLATVAWAVASYVREERDAALDVPMVDFVPPPTAVVADGRAVTDRGTPVPLRVPAAPRERDELDATELKTLRTLPGFDERIRRQPADDRFNCHGWVYTGGRYWVGGEHVDLILRENGYAEVPAPRPGDLAIYRGNGVVTHTAVVRYATDGMPVMVEGKWGWMGIFLHPENGYGGTAMEHRFYRSPRRGHVLAGLGGTPEPVAPVLARSSPPAGGPLHPGEGDPTVEGE